MSTSTIAVRVTIWPVNGSRTCMGMGTCAAAAHADRVDAHLHAPRARSAAVAGSISPALLTPSVTSTTTRLFAFERRRRVSAVARPEPMAVPSGSAPSFTSSSWRSSTAVSVVGGALVRLWPAKMTRPTRSRGALPDEVGHHVAWPRPAGCGAGSPRPPSSRRRRARPRCPRPRWSCPRAAEPHCGRASAAAAATRPAAARASGGVAQARAPAAAHASRRPRPGKAMRAAALLAQPDATSSDAAAPPARPAATSGSAKRNPCSVHATVAPRAPGAGAVSTVSTSWRTMARWRWPSSAAPAPRANFTWSAALVRSRAAKARSWSVGVLAQEGHRLRRRHLQDGRLQPPLEVALGDLGQRDVEGR